MIENKKSKTEIWREYLREGNNLTVSSLIILFLIITLIIYANFLNFIEARPGAVIDDPVLALFDPVDLTVPTFLLLYPSIIIGALFLLNSPRSLFHAVLAYTVLVILRGISMYLLPLDPPPDMIELQDPVVEIFGTGQLLTKDLFFSGHTSLMFLLYLVSRSRWLRLLFLAGTVLTAVAVTAQHVHYSVDVFIAPFMAYCAYAAAKRIFSPDPD